MVWRLVSIGRWSGLREDARSSRRQSPFRVIRVVLKQAGDAAAGRSCLSGKPAARSGSAARAANPDEVRGANIYRIKFKRNPNRAKQSRRRRRITCRNGSRRSRAAPVARNRAELQGLTAGLWRAPGQQAFERRRQRDLNRGCDQRPDLDSARHAIDDALEPPFDLVGQLGRAPCDLHLRNADKLAPFRFRALAKHLGCRIRQATTGIS